MVMGAKRARLVAAVAVCLCAVSPRVGADDFTALLNQGVRAFQQGKTTEAIALFRKAQTLNPNSTEVVEYLEKVGRQALVAAVIRGERIEGDEGRELVAVVTQILRLASDVEQTFIRDEREIAAAVGALLSAKDDLHAWVSAMERARVRHGRYLVPALVKLLDHQEPQERLLAHRALVRLGRDAVVPLIVALDVPAPRVREQIAGILARIGDPLVVSSLKFLAETDADTVVRENAAELLQGFKDRHAITRPAWELLAADAMEFIRARNTLPRAPYRPYTWFMDEGALAGEAVADFQVRRLIADMLLARSTRCAKPGITSWAQFTANRAAQVEVYERNLQMWKQQGAPEAQIALLEGQAKRYLAMAQSMRRAGLDVMAAALVEALAQMQAFAGSGAPAVRLINEIREYSPAAGRHMQAVMALGAALKSANQEVVFEAAMALAQLNAPLADDAAREVVGAFARAIADPGARVALVVSPDDDVRAYFTNMLNSRGFLATASDSAARGLSDAVSFPPKHVVFIDRNVTDLSVPAMLQFLRAARGTADVPVVVISPAAKEEESRDLYQKPAEKVQVVAMNIAVDALKAQVLDPVVAGAQDTRAAGEISAQRAAEAVLGLLTRQAPYSLAGVRDGLMRCAGDVNRPEAVRVPAATALGYLGDGESIRTLAAVVRDAAENPVAVRIASVRAVGEIMQRLNLTVEAVSAAVGDLAGLLEACLAEEDLAVRIEAARTLGKANRNPDVILSAGVSATR